MRQTLLFLVVLVLGSLGTSWAQSGTVNAQVQRDRPGYDSRQLPGDPGPYWGHPYAYPAYLRWQIAVLTTSTSERITVLIDTLNGDTFVLRHDVNVPGGYTWVRLSRF